MNVMNISVTTNRGTLNYTVFHDITVLMFKTLISMSTHVAMKDFWLSFGPPPSLENDKRLSDYNIKNGDCLTAEGKLASDRPEFANYVSLEKRVYIQSLLSRLKALN